MPEQRPLADLLARIRLGRLGQVGRLLVRYFLRPALNSLIALGAMRVGLYLQPDPSDPLGYSAADVEDLRRLYTTSQVPFQTRPEA
ncbi:hypothetical protein ACIRU8_20650 [Streptomyces sp. NPDC101175]|uniref:hypothetical protein n=1 Tax=Streptomyces sp. NPDC101175 TaxID=3366123 RepID=UPI0038398064